jgi:hypothetical protein
LSVGLVACGSGSSSDGEGSTTAVVKKEAGLSSDPRVEVANQTPDDLEVTMCKDIELSLNDSDNCPVGGYLSPGESFNLTLPHQVVGRIGFRTTQDFAGVDYRALSPYVGLPGFDLWKSGTDKRYENPQEFRLSVGETQKADIGVHTYAMSRADDTDYKVMKLTVLR